MPAKVFISCGQRPPKETDLAKKVQQLLKERFDLDSYLAFKVQSFGDIMKITQKLSMCDYYLFIDFRRERIGWRKYRGSLFTHQELALARHLGFSEMIALQEEGVALEGFTRYILSNPEKFKNEDLLKKIERLVAERGWNKDYSRNLIIDDLLKNLPILYLDHSTTTPRKEIIWHCRILNRRNGKAAANTLAILKNIVHPDGHITEPDRTFLKWAFQLKDYSRTIFPRSSASFDLLAVDVNNPLSVYLHSRLDTYLPNSIGSISRQPIISGPVGTYRLTYQVFAENFPLLEFTVELNLTNNIDATSVQLI